MQIPNDTRVIDLNKGQLIEIIGDAFEQKISQIKPPAQNDLMRIELAAEMLNLDKSTLYTKCSRREVPFIKKGKFLWFSRTDLIAWLREGSQKTMEEIQAEKKERRWDERKP